MVWATQRRANPPYMAFGWTSTFSIRLSPISALEMSLPFELQMRMLQVGGGPVLAIVPDVVNMDTLKPIEMS